MSCEEVMELMQRHLDHDLNEEETKGMKEHAEGCEECSDMLRRLELLNEDLENLPKVTPAFSIVDSILPKLQEIDAAANAADDTQAAARQEQEAPVVPMRRPRRSFRTPAWTAGGIAAAAVLLGVMIFNGLPETFKEQSSKSMGDTASSAEATLFSADTASDAPAAKKSASTDEAASTEEAPVMDTASSAEQKQPAEEPQAPVAEPEASDFNKDQSVPEADRRTDRSGKGGQAQVAGAPDSRDGSDEEAVPEQEAAASEPPTVSNPGEGEIYGIAAMPAEPESEPVPQTELQNNAANQNKGFVAAPKPAATKPLANEDGSLEATVQPREDGSFVVVVATQDGAIVFSSEKVWPSGTEVRFNEWTGDSVSYTVVTADGEHTFSIDVSAETENELAR